MQYNAPVDWNNLPELSWEEIFNENFQDLMDHSVDVEAPVYIDLDPFLQLPEIPELPHPEYQPEYPAAGIMEPLLDYHFQNYLDAAIGSYEDLLEPPAIDVQLLGEPQDFPAEQPLLPLPAADEDEDDDDEEPPIPIANTVTTQVQEANPPTKGLSDLVRARYRELARSGNRATPEKVKRHVQRSFNGWSIIAHNLYRGRKGLWKLDYVYMVDEHRNISYGTQQELEEIFGEEDAMAHMQRKWAKGSINKSNLLKYLKKQGLGANTGVMSVFEDDEIDGIRW